MGSMKDVVVRRLRGIVRSKEVVQRRVQLERVIVGRKVVIEWMMEMMAEFMMRLRMKVMIGLGMKRMIELMLGNEREKRRGMMDDRLPILASTEMSGVFGITTRAKSRSLQAVQTSVAFEIKFVSVHRVKEEAQLGG